MTKLKGLNVIRKALQRASGEKPKSSGNPIIDNLRSGNLYEDNQFNTPRDRSGYTVDDSMWLTGRENPTTTVVDGGLDELKAQNQLWIAKAAAGVGRVGVKAASEIAKMPGVMGGVLAGTAGQINDLMTGEDNTDFMQVAFNNGWIKAINEFNETINEELLPVYVRKAVQEGNLWDNIMSVDFWATEGADGLGYIVSMLAPGALINSLKVGKNVLSLANKYKLLGSKVDDAARTLNKLGDYGLPTTAKNIDLWGATMANTLFEAGAEAQSAMDGYEQSLKEQLRNGEIDENEFAEKMQKASIIGRDVFLANTAILLGPNAVMSKMIWGGPRNRATNRILHEGGKLGKHTPSTLEKVGNVGKDLGSAALREGAFEEGLQSTAEGYFTDRAINDEEYSFGDFAQGYADMLQTTDGQKAIFLGAVFGGGMQSYSGAKSRKAERKATHELIDIANEQIASTSYLFSADTYVKDDNGNIVYTKNSKGEQVPKIDFAKARDKILSMEQMEQQSAEYDIAVARGDMESAEMFRKNALTHLALPFILNDNLGIEVFEQHLRESGDIIKAAENENIDVDSIVREAVDIAKQMKQSYDTHMQFAPSVLNIQHEEASSKDIEEYYRKIAVDYVQHNHVKNRVEEAIATKNKQLDQVLAEKGRSREEFETEGAARSALLLKDDRISKLNSDIKFLTEQKEKIDAKTEEYWNNKALQEAFNKEWEAKKQLEKEVEEKEEKAEEALKDIEQAKTVEEVEAARKGKPIDETKRKEEEAAVNELVNRANEDPTLDNLRSVLNDLHNLKVSTFSIEEILNSIEGRISEIVKKQEELKDYLESMFGETMESIDSTKQIIKDIDSKIREQKAARNRILKSIKKSDRNPKGRNAKIIKELVKETEEEIRFLNESIKSLENEKKRLEKELNNLEEQLDYISQRYDQVEITEFTSIEDIVNYIKENSTKFEDHRFDLERLLVHRFYTEQNLEGLSELISSLEIYKDVLEQTIREKLNDLDSSSEDLYFLQEQLNDTNEQLEDARKDYKEAESKLDRLKKAVNSKYAINELTKELQFWEDVQKARKDAPRSIATNNPVVNMRAVEKKRRLAEQKQREQEQKIQEAERARELSQQFQEQLEGERATADDYYNFVEDNMNEGEQIPNPPASVNVPPRIREAEGGYFLVKKHDNKLTLKKGNASFTISKSTSATEKPSGEATNMYQTEGGINNDEVIESTAELPRDEEGNVLDGNLSVINNDARVITGTDSGGKLSFVSDAAITFERSPRNKKTEEVTFKVNTGYRKGNQGKALEILERGATPADIPFLTDHLPINVVFGEGIEAPLETYSTNPNLTVEQRRAYDDVFNKSSKHLRTAIIKEMVLNKRDPSDISTTIAGQKPGQIMVAPKVDGKVAENSILDLYEIAGNIKNVKTDNLYVVNDKGVLENVKGDLHDLGKDASPGEVYMMIHTANGSKFPLKLNIKKVTKPEAELLYELYNYRFQKGTKNTPKNTPISQTTESIKRMVEEAFAEELAEGGLFRKNSKTIDDLTIGDVVDFLIWDGTKSIKSQVRFDDKGGLRVMDKIYSQGEFANAKEEFVNALTSEKGGKRRNVFFKRRPNQTARSLNFENRDYVEYLINNKILNTNALAGKDGDGNYIPTFQGDTTMYLNTNNVRVRDRGNKVLSEHNVEKKITYKNNIRGKKSDLRRNEAGLFKEEMILIEEGQDSYYVQKRFVNNPKRYRWERVSKVTATKDKDLSAPNMYNAAKRGDVIDELIRIYFSKGFESIDEFISKGKSELSKVNKKKTKYGDVTMSDNSFRELWNIIREYEIEFHRRGYTIYSTTNPLYGTLKKDGKEVRVGGAMDLLAKDKMGRYIIIDIKTSSIDRMEDYASENSYYREKDRRQQNAYAELFYQRTGKRVSKILIMPLTVRSEKDEETSANSVYRNITRSKSNSGFIEVDMSENIFEIMGEKPLSSEDTRKKKGASRGKGGNANLDLGSLFGTNVGQEVANIPDDYEAVSNLGETIDPDLLENPISDNTQEALFGDLISLEDAIEASRPTKKKPAPTKKPVPSKQPSTRSARPVDVESNGTSTRYLLWNDGVVTTVENRDKPIKDKKIIDSVLATAGKKAAPGGKSEEDIRKAEKNSVSLQKAQRAMDKIDLSKLSDEAVSAKLKDIARIRTLDRTVKRDLRDILKEPISEREKLEKMFDFLMDKAAANEEVQEICNIK